MSNLMLIYMILLLRDKNIIITLIRLIEKIVTFTSKIITINYW